MKVKFLRDFQGRATREVFYKKGQEVELDSSAADAVVAEGVAEYVTGSRFDVEPQFEQAEEPPHYGAQAEPELRHDDEIHDVMTSKPKAKRSRK